MPFRYIAVESGPRSSVTNPRSQTIHDLLKPTLCPTHMHRQNRADPICRLARLVEGSSLLDKIHTTLNSPTVEHTFNIEEILLTVQALLNLQTILSEELGSKNLLYVGGLRLCNIALLLVFENGSELPVIAGATEDCNSIATGSLISLLSSITDMVEPFTLGTEPVDFNSLPPFVTFEVHKAAAIVTKRLVVGTNTIEGLRQLRILRRFLRIVEERWLGSRRYLRLLDEDTTPRISKALEQG